MSGEPESPEIFSMEVEPGVHWGCSCGKSGHPPFCDGSHKGTGMQPVRKELAEKTIVRWRVTDGKTSFLEAGASAE